MFREVSHIIESTRSSLISSVKFVMNTKIYEIAILSHHTLLWLLWLEIYEYENVWNYNPFTPHSFVSFVTWNLSWIWKCMKLQSFHTTLFCAFCDLKSVMNMKMYEIAILSPHTLLCLLGLEICHEYENVWNWNPFTPHSFVPFVTWNLSWIWECMKLQSFHYTLYCGFVPMLGPGQRYSVIFLMDMFLEK
jgi:hypothetical protein